MRRKIFSQTNFKNDIYTKAMYITKNNFINGKEKITQLEELNKMVFEMYNFNYINYVICKDLTQLIILLQSNVYHDFDKDKEIYKDE